MNKRKFLKIPFTKTAPPSDFPISVKILEAFSLKTLELSLTRFPLPLHPVSYQVQWILHIQCVRLVSSFHHFCHDAVRPFIIALCALPNACQVLLESQMLSKIPVPSYCFPPLRGK
jgi:hypothetical protein